MTSALWTLGNPGGQREMSHGHMIVGDVTDGDNIILSSSIAESLSGFIIFFGKHDTMIRSLSIVCCWMPILTNTDVDTENLKETVWNKPLWLEIETRQESWSIYALYKVKGWD